MGFDFEVGQDGAIANFMDDIAEACYHSNGFALEIGTATGTGSTMAIQRGLLVWAGAHPGKDPLHLSIDHRDYMQWKPTVGWWDFIIGDSRLEATVMLAGLIAAKRSYQSPGVIFIDTDHTYGQMRDELAVWGPVASPDTVWLFHDTHMWGEPNDGMVRAIREFADANPGWVYEDWRTEQHGLGRMRHA